MSTGIFCQGNFKFSLSLLEAVTASGAAAGITSATVTASAGIASAAGAGAFRFRKRVGTDTLLGHLQFKPVGIKGSHPHFFFFNGHTPGYSQIQVVEQEAQDNRQEQVVDPLHGPPDAAAGEKSLALLKGSDGTIVVAFGAGQPIDIIVMELASRLRIICRVGPVQYR